MANSQKLNHRFIRGMVVVCLGVNIQAGPYSAASNDPGNVNDAPVPGFLGPHGSGKARLQSGEDELGNPVFENPGNFVNPLFFAWATEVEAYHRADSGISFSDTELALGEVSGDPFDVVSLGDLSAAEILANANPGFITVKLAKPVKNLSGNDFVVFENGLLAQSNTGGAGLGGILAELAYVEVSANGSDFIRFPSTSLTPTAVGGYGSVNPTNLHNLAGKHVNSYGDSWGTPFDLAQVGLQEITHVRLVDIPGNGAYRDQAGRPVFDAWLTFGSGGFDLEAIGSISTTMTYAEWPQLQKLEPGQRGESDDPDGDGLPNLLEYAFSRIPWLADAAGAVPSCRMVTEVGAVYPEFRFLRDERLLDLTYEVQVSENPAAGPWTTLAASVAGSPVLPALGQVPVIVEASASAISGLGVIREVRIRDSVPVGVFGKRFFRLKVTHP